MYNFVQTLAIYALPVLFAITLHEAAHGFVARHFGDPTAWQAGRITLNPMKHIDPIGTVLIPALTVLLGGFFFGWAKPVPVDFSRLRHPKQDMLWVAAAGPGANLFMALLWALVLKLAVVMPENLYSLPLAEMARAGIQVNAALMLLNLLPIPPLDGGRIAVSLLPAGLAWRLARLERYGLLILVTLIFFGLLDRILTPLLRSFLFFVKNLFAL
ncbi:MAG: site-2 protease family protein [Rhodocyclaceae bacterium]|nr:site-2 protease family protein [Rhodocyclaceae bacterium]